VVTARHIAEATDRVGRGHLWRTAEMMLRGSGGGRPGRLYVEVLVGRGDGAFARKEHLRPLPLRRVVEELQARGATVVARGHARQGGREDGAARHRVGRLVVEWQR
jgi:hypothetical protein